MAEYGQYTAHSFVAENSFEGKAYRFVELNSTSGQCDICDGIGDVVLGVVTNDPKANEPATVVVDGIIKVMAGASISIGNKITTGAAGTAIVANSGSVWVAGTAITACNSGNFFTLKMEGYQLVAA